MDLGREHEASVSSIFMRSDDDDYGYVRKQANVGSAIKYLHKKDLPCILIIQIFLQQHMFYSYNRRSKQVL